MTHDHRNENFQKAEHFERHDKPHGRHGGWHGWDGMSWVNRPGFHPLKALTVLAGFAVFPPLGVLALGYFLWNSRHNFGRNSAAGEEQFAGGSGTWRERCGPGRGRGMRGRFTGNAAFDAHQAEAIDKLREERRAFFEYRASERRKRDEQSYEAFRANQDKAPDSDDGSKA